MEPFKCRTTQHSKRYQYKGHWIDIALQADFSQKNFWYQATIELPNQAGVISEYPYPSLDQAECAAEEMIDSWN